MPVPLTPEKKQEQELCARTTRVGDPGNTHDTTTTPPGHMTQNTRRQNSMDVEGAAEGHTDATRPGPTGENQAVEGNTQADPTRQTLAGHTVQNQLAAGHNTEQLQVRHGEQTEHTVTPAGQRRAGTAQVEEKRTGQTEQSQPRHTTEDSPTAEQREEKEGQKGQQQPQVDPDVVAGYRDCLKETIRFLVEEESLPDDHPVVRGLAVHLTRQHAHIELSKLSQQLSAQTPSPTPNTTTDPTPLISITTPPTTPPTQPLTGGYNTGFEVTLVEDSGDEDDEDDEELIIIDQEMEVQEWEGECDNESDCEFESDPESEFASSRRNEYESGSSNEYESDESPVVLRDPELHRQLLRLVYQGCDLYAAPVVGFY
ncbi:hypothetical protein Pmani_009913 [Petrolisthes manimaculis]|uniref:Uncharacterized protein n=1 Tax=Petrolisthes manimaculis TaxID=1843537 RepID=A0AAE1Q2F9_9EUCA|nr:hypothetical protein Pmani_009913 [Petrolisthes manimaculis]